MMRIGIPGLVGLALLSGCASGRSQPAPPPASAVSGADFPNWSTRDPEYRFFPGDKLRLDVRTAPELSGDLTIAPDGRVTVPNMGAVMAANLTATQLQASLQQLLATELLDPSLVVTPVEFASQKIFVGGEVREPGIYDLPGEINTLQAILMAGGWTDEGKPSHVLVMRRTPGGQMSSKRVDVRGAIRADQLDAIGPLHRFDVVYVSRKMIADENLFMRQFIRDALPIDFGLYYDISRF
ncbi:MAG: polysaccharide biosynthesis/export family protein [Hyphomonadaceae bacterium]